MLELGSLTAAQHTPTPAPDVTLNTELTRYMYVLVLSYYTMSHTLLLPAVYLLSVDGSQNVLIILKYNLIKGLY